MTPRRGPPPTPTGYRKIKLSLCAGKLEMHNNLNSILFRTTKHAVLILIPVLILASCNPAKYVPDGSYLLSKNKVEVTQKKTISQDQLESYLLQKPNKKILGVRFHLFLYNLSNIKKNNWFHNWLRRIGEEPVVFNPAQTKGSADQLHQFMENKGYYHSKVSDTVTFRKKNAIAKYKIVPGDPYKVRKITYYFEDTSLMSTGTARYNQFAGEAGNEVR